MLIPYFVCLKSMKVWYFWKKQHHINKTNEIIIIKVVIISLEGDESYQIEIEFKLNLLINQFGSLNSVETRSAGIFEGGSEREILKFIQSYKCV